MFKRTVNNSSSEIWWPPELGAPSTFGSTDAGRYAFFPRKQCLAIERNGVVNLYETGDIQFRGVLQQCGEEDLSFQSQHGRVQVSSLAQPTVRS